MVLFSGRNINIQLRVVIIKEVLMNILIQNLCYFNTFVLFRASKLDQIKVLGGSQLQMETNNIN